MKLPPLPSIGEVLAIYNVKATEKLGQNFLINAYESAKFVRTMGTISPQSVVMEVGPGVGSITRALLDAGAEKLVAIEKDTRLLPMLGKLSDASEGRLHVIHGDAMSFKGLEALKQIVDPSVVPEKVHIVGNLPFNIATPLITKWVHEVLVDQTFGTSLQGKVDFTLGVQKEFGERMTAPIGSGDRGPVDACVIRMDPHPARLLDASVSSHYFMSLLKYTFQQRKKMLRSSLSTILGPSAQDILAENNIDPASRPQELEAADFCRLAGILHRRKISF
ncbi:Dimethyladenosine transferase 1, mitochondrial [Rhizophlyctis rosea]|nr:Dimethyladenosine transferase 1, mitochondrial [Rhizophlyctis rosea]